MKRVIVLSDMHCGSHYGLTPPSWHSDPNKDTPPEIKKAEKTRQALWEIFDEEVRKLAPYDICICNGDAIDGDQWRQGGIELLEPDRLRQAEMAARCIAKTHAKQIFIVAGTGYHAGEREDLERVVCGHLERLGYGPKVSMHDHLYANIDGVRFDCKHHVGGSSIPHGRFTSVRKEGLWADAWSRKGVTPGSPEILIRSHVHYFSACLDSLGWYITTPGLQGLGSNYGVRRCSGIVDWGFIVFDVYGPEYDCMFVPHFVLPEEANTVQKVEEVVC